MRSAHADRHHRHGPPNSACDGSRGCSPRRPPMLTTSEKANGAVRADRGAPARLAPCPSNGPGRDGLGRTGPALGQRPVVSPPIDEHDPEPPLV